MDNRFIIDWLSFTIPVQIQNRRDLQSLRVKEIAREIGLDFDYELRERGRFGYTRSFVFQIVLPFYLMIMICLSLRLMKDRSK